MPIPKGKLRRCLVQKFRFQEVPGSRHEAVALFADDKKIATARFSRSRTEIDDNVLTLIARELWVNLGYLKRMYDCTKGYQDYLDRLRKTGHL